MAQQGDGDDREGTGSEAEMGESGETEPERENGERTGQTWRVGRGPGPAPPLQTWARSRHGWSDIPGLPRARCVKEEPG